MDTHISGHWVRHSGDRNDKKKNKLDIFLEEPTVWWAAC